MNDRKTKEYWTPEKKQEAVELICEKIADGFSLNKVFREYKQELPNKMTFLMNWLNADEFTNQYRRALLTRQDFHFEELKEIADEPNPVAMDKFAASAFEQQRKTRIHTRMWILSRENPKKYGDKVDVDLQDNPTTKAYKDIITTLNERLKKEENKEELNLVKLVE